MGRHLVDVFLFGGFGSAHRKRVNRFNPRAPEIPPHILSPLLEAAMKFRERAPWEFLGPLSMLAVVDPVTSRYYVAGTIKDEVVTGLVLHRDYEGLRSCLSVLRGAGEGEEESLDIALEQSLIVVDFTQRNKLDPADLNLLTKSGWKSGRRRRGYAKFRSWLPYADPKYINAEEARITMLVLQRFNHFLGGNPPPSPDQRDDSPTLPTYRFAGGDPERDMDWRLSMEAFPELPAQAAPKSFGDFEERLEELNAMDLEQMGEWELRIAPTDLRVSDGRNGILRVGVIVDTEDPEAFYVEPIYPESPATFHRVEMLLRAVVQAEALPVSLALRAADVDHLLVDVCARLGIQVEIAEALPAADDALEAAIKSLRAHLN